jgi:hypothetical protein
MKDPLCHAELLNNGQVPVALHNASLRSFASRRSVLGRNNLPKLLSGCMGDPAVVVKRGGGEHAEHLWRARLLAEDTIETG